MKRHELKQDIAGYFQIWDLNKKSTFRKNDRNYEVGDYIRFRPFNTDKKEYLNSHSFVEAKITHISHGPKFRIPKGFCVISFQPTFLQPREN